jgi:hypothetical protein
MDPRERIREMEEKIEDLKRRIPKHSIPPAMMAELDTLEEELEGLREEDSS